MDQIFFDGWQSLVRTVIVALLAYPTLVVLLRISGNRTLSKMNAFDFVVTVALGSTLATILINKNVSLAQGTLALLLLIALQFAVTWSSVRVAWVRGVVTGEPVLLVYRGEFLAPSMRRSRVREDEVWAAIRGSGVATLDEVEAVVLETDGSFSVVRPGKSSGRSSLLGIISPENIPKSGAKINGRDS